MRTSSLRWPLVTPTGYWDGSYGYIAERYRDGWLALEAELAAIDAPLEFQADYETTRAFVEHALASAACLVEAAAGTLPPEESNELVNTCVRPENEKAQLLIDSMADK